AVLHLDPAELAVATANGDGELDGFARHVTPHAIAARLLPALAHVKALPPPPPVFIVTAAVHAFGADGPHQLVEPGLVQRVFVNRAAGLLGDRAITRVVQRQLVLVRLAAVDVARVGDDAEHGRVGEGIDRDAFQPQPAAVAVPEAILEAVELRLAVRSREKPAEA